MRITVLSDSHGAMGTVERIVSEQENVKDVFFLGDVVSDIEDCMFIYPQLNYYIIKGNCDFDIECGYKIAEIGGKRILYTHGHRLGVKYGIEKLKEAAIENRADIVLYGHTHVANILYDDGVYYVNPGSVSRPREGFASYAVIDIDGKNILPAILRT